MPALRHHNVHHYDFNPSYNIEIHRFNMSSCSVLLLLCLLAVHAISSESRLLSSGSSLETGELLTRAASCSGRAARPFVTQLLHRRADCRLLSIISLAYAFDTRIKLRLNFWSTLMRHAAAGRLLRQYQPLASAAQGNSTAAWSKRTSHMLAVLTYVCSLCRKQRCCAAVVLLPKIPA